MRGEGRDKSRKHEARKDARRMTRRVRHMVILSGRRWEIRCSPARAAACGPRALGWRGEILGAAPQPASQAKLEAVEVAEHNLDHEQAERGQCQKNADTGERDRKSVVSGKSASVRVDIGILCII